MGLQRDYFIKKISSAESSTSWLNFKYLFQNMDNTLLLIKMGLIIFKNTFYLAMWEIVNPLWPNSYFLPPKLPIPTLQSRMINSGKVKTAKNKVYGEVSCNINKRPNHQPHL